MQVRVRLPANMRALADDLSVVEVQAADVGEAVRELTAKYPELGPRLLNPDGTLQVFVNLFVDDVSIRDLQDLQTPLAESSEILIVSALAGG